uniref:Uncharacterized protein n=1 Tax=Arundo donax TaxID=35708 RepID=A0A0A9HCA9_ARUDO
MKEQNGVWNCLNILKQLGSSNEPGLVVPDK